MFNVFNRAHLSTRCYVVDHRTTIRTGSRWCMISSMSLFKCNVTSRPRHAPCWHLYLTVIRPRGWAPLPRTPQISCPIHSSVTSIGATWGTARYPLLTNLSYRALMTHVTLTKCSQMRGRSKLPNKPYLTLSPERLISRLSRTTGIISVVWRQIKLQPERLPPSNNNNLPEICEWKKEEDIII